VAGSPPAADRGRGFQKADVVARRGLEGLVRGKHWVIPSFANNAMVFTQRFVPRRTVSGAAERMFRPESVKSALKK
jgi:short-subunit dehydrogenase